MEGCPSVSGSSRMDNRDCELMRPLHLIFEEAFIHLHQVVLLLT
jgi:hypothetical protein